MYKSVLMHTDIDKCSEINNISNRALESHAGLQVLHLEDVAPEHRLRELLTGIARRLLDLGHDVLECYLTAVKLTGKCGKVCDCLSERSDCFLVLDLAADLLKECSCLRIGLRVYCRRIKRLFASRDPAEARTLLESFGSELGDLQELRSRAEPSVLFSVCNDVLGDCNVYARDVRQ